MTAATHTPGPWRIAPASHYAGSELNVDAGDNGTGGYICSPGQRDDAEAVANARLIAAAPDMLAALREIEEMADDRADVDDGIPNEAMRMLVIVRAAIARAGGGS